MSPWDILVPPLGGDDLLRRRVAHIMESRLRRVLRAWKGRSRARGFPKLGRRAGPLPEALGALRGFVHAAEESLDLLEAASRKSGRSALVTRVADMGLLAKLAPSGRLPRDFAERAVRAARAQLRKQVEAWNVSHRVRRDDPDLGLRAGDAPIPQGISVGRVVRTRGTEVEILEEDPRFRENVFHALNFLGAVWPEAAQMVLGRTWRVVPVEEKAIVSYSSAVRPGITWIHRFLGRGRGADGAMRLAEHLLHEGTHQRVHDLEVLAPIAPPEEDGPRFYSPWRREWRPLRGLLHGACTFTVGAGYFARVLQALEEQRLVLDPAVRPWLTRRFLEEMENVRVALRYLDRAQLPTAGKRLLKTVKREHAALRTEARRRRAALSGGERAKMEAHAHELRTQPLRWG